MIPIASPEYIQPTNEIIASFGFIWCMFFLSFSSQEKIKPNKQSSKTQLKSSKVAANTKTHLIFFLCHMDPRETLPRPAKLVQETSNGDLDDQPPGIWSDWAVGNDYFSIPNEDQEKYYLDGDCSIIQLGSIVLSHTQVSE